MKRIDLIRQLEQAGCQLIRHGSNHDWYRNPVSRMAQPVPQHREINDTIAKHILKKLLD